MNHLALMVEGYGDIQAVPILTRRLITEIKGKGWDSELRLDPAVIRLGNVHAVTGKNQSNWTNRIQVAANRANTKGILVILDGDADIVEGKNFCAREVATTMIRRARDIGAGTIFSLALVFAVREFETWLLGAFESLAGKRFLDKTLPGDLKLSKSYPDLEQYPRDAKGTLGDELRLPSYKETIHQAPLTQLIDLQRVRDCNLPSFGRFERAVKELLIAIETGSHIATPDSDFS